MDTVALCVRFSVTPYPGGGVLQVSSDGQMGRIFWVFEIHNLGTFWGIENAKLTLSPVSQVLYLNATRARFPAEI